MGKMARSKGQRGEREIVHLLQPYVNKAFQDCGLQPPLIQRNQLQSDRGGYDLVGVPWMAPEVKRCETLNLKAWWKQCMEQAKDGQTPVLFYRQNASKWRVRMVGILPATGCKDVKVVVDISIDAFLHYFYQRCQYEAETIRDGRTQFANGLFV